MAVPRHCEERSDEAIQRARRGTGLLRFARNDGVGAAALLALAGCGKAAEEQPVNQVQAAPPPVVKKVEPPKSRPTEPARFVFAGAWAASEELCAGGDVWRFSRDAVEADGASCAVESIADETATGATLELSCPAPDAEGKQRWTLFTGPDGTMIVQRYADGVMRTPRQSLVRCDDPA